MHLSLALITMPWLSSLLAVKALAFLSQLPPCGCIQLIRLRWGKGLALLGASLLAKGFHVTGPLYLYPSLSYFFALDHMQPK